MSYNIATPRPATLCGFCGSEHNYCSSSLDAAICAHGPKNQQQGKNPNKVEAILDERGSRYGSFIDNARISQDLYDIVLRENEARIKRGQLPLQYHQKEALKMICAKMCRILSGDPDYEDNWDDIGGYSSLGKHPR